MPELDPAAIALALIAFSTSTVAGVFGFGGGMLLIASLPTFLPAAALVPVHSAVQLLSNSSRAIMAWRHIQWQFVAQHTLGSILGVALATLLVFNVSLTLIPIMIGCYILLTTWSNAFQRLVGRFESFFLIGAIQSGLGLMVGAPGPLPMPLLLRRLDNHHQIVCTMAIFMTTGHILKIIVFIGAGFAFSSYAAEIVLMGIAAIAGSLIGTRLRNKLDAKRFVWIVKVMLTLLALLAIWRALANYG
ncbi:MAG: sulfite exporter TauE/SafE family protein [Gammaproteobacteria bacterium]|nr:sulfite exporter TauE/SafE family protein [Gammaproteobacteria bacterium]MBT8151870.1 sulfite exporter TauE/SafE family protein [Gammaproteobacteria bacterium]NNM11307.1 sulfite exporter TauE/SafE family protein [Pseudomonadales bacterium]